MHSPYHGVVSRLKALFGSTILLPFFMFATTLNQSVGSLSHAYSIVEPRPTTDSVLASRRSEKEQMAGQMIVHEAMKPASTIHPCVIFALFPTSYFFVVDAFANISSVVRNAKTVPSIRQVNALIAVSISFRFQKTNGLCTSALNPFFCNRNEFLGASLGNVKKNVISYAALRSRLSLCCDIILVFSSNAVQRWSIARNRFGNGKNIAAYRAYH